MTAAEPRLFAAVPLPEPARAEIAALVGRIRERVEEGADPRTAVRWVRLDGLHLTLRFLGPTPERDVGAIAEAVAAAAATHQPFAIAIDGAGAFPSPARPRTLWLAVTQGADRLAAMAADLDARFERLGWPRPDRPFRAHLTLARSDGRRLGPPTAAALLELGGAFRLATTADRITLYESVTGGGPARYVPRHEPLLGGSPGAAGTPG